MDEYRFYLDLEGHAASEPVQAALVAIEPYTSQVRILGTYPQGDKGPRADPA